MLLKQEDRTSLSAEKLKCFLGLVSEDKNKTVDRCLKALLGSSNFEMSSFFLNNL